ncbi:MAG: VWA domain-containing protein [Deltaproteobacteria bacterium]|nr:VWA domain-containing protein [Deltaproteobacteria bacterium]
MLPFAHPWFLLLTFIPLALIFWEVFVQAKVKLDFPLASRVKKLSRWTDPLRANLHRVFLWTALFLIAIALARPQWKWQEVETSSEGIDIILALDTSRSMDARDFRLDAQTVSRLTVVKKVVAEFISGQFGNRIGLVVFGQYAFTQSPLTFDYNYVINLMKQLEIGMAGDGTAIGDGLGLSLKRISESKSKSKVVILLTDGRNNYGKLPPKSAAEIAKKLGVRVYTIGIGTQGRAFVPGVGYVQLDLDLETLQEIAQATDGKFYHATDSRALKEIYAEIAKLEKTKITETQYEVKKELYAYFVALALLLVFLEMIFSATWLRRVV